jgi:hypothetical protein
MVRVLSTLYVVRVANVGGREREREREEKAKNLLTDKNWPLPK